MKTVKEIFEEQGIYDGAVLIDPTRRFSIIPVDWKRMNEFIKEKEKKLGERYDKTGEGDYTN